MSTPTRSTSTRSPTPRNPATRTSTAPATSAAATAHVAGIRDRERCDTLVLAALRTADRDGYGVLRRLEEAAGRTRRPSARQVFASLHRLHRNRLVRRSSDDPRAYRLTATGSRVLTARTAAADAYAGALHQLRD